MNTIKSMFRDLSFHRGQIILFCFCLFFSMGIFISVDSLRYNVEDYISQDSKELLGGDLEIEANRMYSENLTKALEKVELEFQVEISNLYDFSSVILSEKTNFTTLSQLKVIEKNYPLYGEIEIGSGKDFNLNEGEVIVEQTLLDQLEVSIGDELKIGNSYYIIKDTLISEPDSPLTLFSIGPKILIPMEGINETGLVGSKSRIEYVTKIQTFNEEDTTQIYEMLENALGEREDLERYDTADSNLQEFVFNFLFFIKLISIFIVFITGIGLTSTLSSYLTSMETTNGIKKVLGTKNNDLMGYYIKTVLLLVSISFILALVFASLFITILPQVLESVLPSDLEISLSLIAIIKGAILALCIGLLFTLYPIFMLREIKPLSLFRKEQVSPKLFSRIIFGLIILIFFAAFIIIEINSIFYGSIILIGTGVLFGVIIGLSIIVLKLLKWIASTIKYLPLKLALRGLFRIGNKTLLIITSISISLTLIFSLTFIEINLQNQFITSFPEDAPNLFIVDIPKPQVENISLLLNQYAETQIYPIIRGPALSINDKSIEEINEELREGEPITREFSLTYNDKLLDSEKLVIGDSLFIENWDKDINQVSVMDEIADRMGLEVGDRIVFLVQGIEIEAEVVSIRQRLEQGIGAFFYFVFEPEVLENAPQTLFSTLRVEETQERRDLQVQLAREYPTVTVIDAETTAKTVGDIISQLSSITSFFTIFSLIGGILILVSSIVATSAQRLKESIYYKLVGGSKAFIRKIFLLEYILIALISSLFSFLVALIISFSVSTFIFDINFSFLVIEGLIFIGTTIITIVLIGYLSVIPILRKKPLEYIRENNIE